MTLFFSNNFTSNNGMGNVELVKLYFSTSSVKFLPTWYLCWPTMYFGRITHLKHCPSVFCGLMTALLFSISAGNGIQWYIIMIHPYTPNNNPSIICSKNTLPRSWYAFCSANNFVNYCVKTPSKEKNISNLTVLKIISG